MKRRSFMLVLAALGMVAYVLYPAPLVRAAEAAAKSFFP